jgi:hypothetical protein
MPSRRRDPAPPSPAPQRQMRQPRPWPALPAPSQRQLAQAIARLLRRVYQEAQHADRTR